MSINLTVASAISGTLQPVTDQNNNAGALSLGTTGAAVKGVDSVGICLPMEIIGKTPATGDSWGRLLRLSGMNGTYFDFGIDAKGNLFINTPSSTATSHALTMSPSGVVSIGSLTLPNLTATPGITADVVIDPATGIVHKQS